MAQSSLRNIWRSAVAIVCLSVALTAHAQSPRPTDDSSDEAGLWYAVDKIEEYVKLSGARITDPVLINYAQRVTCAVTGPACKDIRLYIINEPSFNASMYPNGMMLIHSGLLLRAENEAQLSCVIGHEYGHFKQDHSLQRWRRAKNIANASILLNIVGAAAGAGQETSIGTSIAGVLAQQSFSREHEREADTIGFEQAAGAGYSADQCAKVWTNLISESEASEFKKVRNQATKSSLLSTHPVPIERAQTLEDMAKKMPGGANKGESAHKLATGSHFEQWVNTELLAKDYDRHIHLFEQLKARGQNAALLDFYIGEAYRLRREDGDSVLAMAAWERSAAQDGAPAQVWKMLGEQYRREKRNDDALMAYRKYLAASPNAPDKAFIERYIQRLSQ